MRNVMKITEKEIILTPTGVVAEMERLHPEMMAAFRKIQEEQYELFARKQMAYGRGNIMLGGDINVLSDRIAAIRGITIRLNDKIQRLINLVLKGVDNPIQNENITDTFIDISVYGIIAQIVDRGDWK
jgi:hypothetical protein